MVSDRYTCRILTFILILIPDTTIIRCYHPLSIRRNIDCIVAGRLCRQCLPFTLTQTVNIPGQQLCIINTPGCIHRQCPWDLFLFSIPDLYRFLLLLKCIDIPLSGTHDHLLSAFIIYRITDIQCRPKTGLLNDRSIGLNGIIPDSLRSFHGNRYDTVPTGQCHDISILIRGILCTVLLMKYRIYILPLFIKVQDPFLAHPGPLPAIYHVGYIDTAIRIITDQRCIIKVLA